MKHVAIIPARAGSKRIPGKNIRDFHGIPALGRVIGMAIESGCFSEVMVSTDSKEIADIAKKFGAQVPFMRSNECSNDTATTSAVLHEVLSGYQRVGESFDCACCLYPTAVLITPERVREGLDVLKASPAAQMLQTISSYPHPIQRAMKLRDGCLEVLDPKQSAVRTQDLETYYFDAGQFYWFSVNELQVGSGKELSELVRTGLVLDPWEVQDIDVEEDFLMAEIKFRMNAGKKGID